MWHLPSMRPHRTRTRTHLSAGELEDIDFIQITIDDKKGGAIKKSAFLILAGAGAGAGSRSFASQAWCLFLHCLSVSSHPSLPNTNAALSEGRAAGSRSMPILLSADASPASPVPSHRHVNYSVRCPSSSLLTPLPRLPSHPTGT